MPPPHLRPTALETATGWSRGTPAPDRPLKGNSPHPPPPLTSSEDRHTHTPIDTSWAHLGKKILLVSYVQYSDFKHKILSVISSGRQTRSDAAWPFAVHTCFVPSVLSRKKRWPKGLTDNRCQPFPHTSPQPSPRVPSRCSQRTSPHQVLGPKHSHSPASLQETIYIQ